MTLIADYVRKRNSINFEEINRAALVHLPSLVRVWCPQGYLRGAEWVSLNPTRPSDRKAGSFSINIRSGRWADFATGDKGGDVISLAAYIFGTSQVDAARTLATSLGVRA